MVQTTQNLEVFDKKPFFKTIFDKALKPFWKTFLLLKQLLNAKLLISRLSFSVFKNHCSPTHVGPNQVKNSTKHSRPD